MFCESFLKSIRAGQETKESIIAEGRKHIQLEPVLEIAKAAEIAGIDVWEEFADRIRWDKWDICDLMETCKDANSRTWWLKLMGTGRLNEMEMSLIPSIVL